MARRASWRSSRRKLLDGQQATINGSGEQTRDFVYVDDVVAANLAASDAEWQGEYNVGTGVETTINELYDVAGVDRRRRYAGGACAGEGRRTAAQRPRWQPSCARWRICPNGNRCPRG